MPYNPSQSIGSTIASNCALMSTPVANTKLKRRKLSSAQSKSPETTAPPKGK